MSYTKKQAKLLKLYCIAANVSPHTPADDAIDEFEGWLSIMGIKLSDERSIERLIDFLQRIIDNGFQGEWRAFHYFNPLECCIEWDL